MASSYYLCQLALSYLKNIFPSQESYVFTASTFMDFDESEHIPFLLIGSQHILDDPLSKLNRCLNGKLILSLSVSIILFNMFSLEYFSMSSMLLHLVK
mgnify:CR=1 FL=1